MNRIIVGFFALFGVYGSLFLGMAYAKAICGAGSLIIFPWLLTGIPWVWGVKSWINNLLSTPDAEGQLCISLPAMALLVGATGVNVVLIGSIAWLLFRRKCKQGK